MESKGPLSKTLINLKYSCYLNAGNLSNIRNEKKQALQFYDKVSFLNVRKFLTISDKFKIKT